MYLTKEQADTFIVNWTKETVADYRKHLLFITNLLQNDDYTFVVKSHALIEALLNELVNEFLEKPDLITFIEKLPLHGKDISKISIAQKLNILQKEEHRFIERFSTIRNNIVHKVENCNFTFDSYIKGLDKNQLKAFKLALLITPDMQKNMEIFFEKDLIFAVWYSLYMLIIQLVSKITNKRGSSKIDSEAMITTLELLNGVH